MKQLRKYQEEGVAFLKNRGAALLADEPGLGKTGTSIKTVVELDAWRILVLCPHTMLYVWESEIYDWDDNCEVCVVEGSYQEKKKKLLEGFEAGNPKRKYIITNWETLSQKKQLPLANLPWDVVIGDEIHKIKNRNAKMSKALKQITNVGKKKIRKYGLSGTPYINSADELWSILNWLDPVRWSSYWQFVNKYMIVHDTPFGKQYKNLKNDGIELQQDIRPWYLRRRKVEVLKELPPKQYQHIWTDISKTQYDMYMTMKHDFIAEFGDTYVDAATQLAQHIRFRQLVVSPAVLDPTFPDDSPRLDTAVEYIEQMAGPVVVFSHFVAGTTLMKARLEKRGIPCEIITGAVSAHERHRIIQWFQGQPKTTTCAVLCTIGAGGVGTTLTNANTVVFLDQDWSPSVNAQAEDRCHRFGQKDPVTIVTLAIPQTIDMRVMQVLHGKSSEFGKVFSSDVIGTPPKPGKLNIREAEKAIWDSEE